MPSVNLPPPLVNASMDDFRKTLVGLSEPTPPEGIVIDQHVRNLAVDFIGMLADLYGRVHVGHAENMWPHIIKTLNIAGTAATDRDFTAFACECLPPLQIPGDTAAYDPAFQKWLSLFEPDDVRARRVVKYLTGPTQVAAAAFARNERKEKQAIRRQANEVSPQGGTDHA